MSLTVELVPQPADGTEVHPLVEAYVAVVRRVHVATLGNDDLVDAASAVALNLYEQKHKTKVLLVARDGAAVVGGCFFGMPLRDNRTLAEGDFTIDPDADVAEVLPLLWDGIRPVLVQAGRHTAQVWMSHRIEETIPQLTPRTGVGSLPSDEFTTTLQNLGFVLEQVERHSVLEVAHALPVARGEGVRAAAAAGADYELLSWVGATPSELLDQVAVIAARMSTDVPSGELDLEPEVWDAERVMESDRITALMGRRRFSTVARHVPTGQVVAYSEIDQPGDKPTVAYQEDTLVQSDHRGHRLGMLVKARNLELLAAQAPDVARIHTWNAGENDHMLAINHALGFRDRSLEGAWQITGL